MNIVTIIGVSILFSYSLINILKFYGIQEDVYGIYISFYLLLVACVVFLPTEYSKM
jgi:hypothetical protein